MAEHPFNPNSIECSGCFFMTLILVMSSNKLQDRKRTEKSPFDKAGVIFERSRWFYARSWEAKVHQRDMHSSLAIEKTLNKNLFSVYFNSIYRCISRKASLGEKSNHF